MSTVSNERVPEWTRGDRLRKARSLTGMTTRQFAEAIGVSHGTVNSAETDRRAVRKITLNAWALATRVSVEWLETGQSSEVTPPPNDGRPAEDLDRLTRAKRGRARPPVNTPRYLSPEISAA